MSDMIKKALIKEAITEVLNDRDRLDAETHKEDHLYIGAKRKQAEAWGRFWDEMTKYIVKLGVLGVITIVGAAVWYYFVHLVNGGS